MLMKTYIFVWGQIFLSVLYNDIITHLINQITVGGVAEEALKQVEFIIQVC